MKLALPKFQYRFVSQLGNVIHPGNFHPVGTQLHMQRGLDRVEAKAAAGEGGAWLVVGGSGGFGSAARAVLGKGLGAHTLNLSFDAAPNPESSNKIRKLGSPGWHRNLALEKGLTGLGTTARSINGDAFSLEVREQVIAELKEHFGGKLKGLVWALAAPRAVDPRTGKAVASALRPLGKTIQVKTFGPADPAKGEPSRISETEIPPGTPEEAIRTIFVMGGGIVRQWVDSLLAADVLDEGFRLLTISYRGNELNAGIYRKGLIGLAKADLEFETAALDHVLKQKLSGRALAVEGPAVVTEASGGIPGVPLYLANALDIMGDRFEDPLASMSRMFFEKLGDEPEVDGEGLVRMDDIELSDEFQPEFERRYNAAKVGDPFDQKLYDGFMSAYEQTRGFSVEGVDYDAEFDTDDVCQ